MHFKQYILKIVYCDIYISTDIYSYIIQIKLSRCKLFNCLETLKSMKMTQKTKTLHTLSYSKSIQKSCIHLTSLNDNLNIHLNNCILPRNLQILRIFQSIEIHDCISPFVIKSNFQKLKVKNHMGEFSISQCS